MKRIILFALLLIVGASIADVKISELPLIDPSNVTNVNDSFPFVLSTQNKTSRLKLSDILKLPLLQSPTFTGTVTAGNFVGPVTGAWVSVANFGAAGDGSDQTTAIQNAINSISAGVIFVPRGTYGISSELLLSDKKVLMGEGRDSSILAALSNSINIVHHIGSNGGVRDLKIIANSKTGISALRITPQDESQTTVLTNQNYNVYSNIWILGTDEGIVLQAGPDVTGTDSGCWYNSFYSIHIQSAKRGIWMKDPSNAGGSSVNYTRFYSIRIGQINSNTGVQIDAGSGSEFHGISFEGIAEGTSPNATPRSIYITESSAVSGADNNHNKFFGASDEGSPTSLVNENSYSEFYSTTLGGDLTLTALPMIMEGGSSPSVMPLINTAYLWQANSQIPGYDNNTFYARGPLNVPSVSLIGASAFTPVLGLTSLIKIQSPNSSSGDAVAMTTDSAGRAVGIYTQDFDSGTNAGSRLLFGLSSGSGNTRTGIINVGNNGTSTNGTLSVQTGSGPTTFGGTVDVTGLTTLSTSSHTGQANFGATSFAPVTGLTDKVRIQNTNTNSGDALVLSTDSVGRAMTIYTQDFSGSTGSKISLGLGTGSGTTTGTIGVTAGGAQGTLSLQPGGGPITNGGDFTSSGRAFLGGSFAATTGLTDRVRIQGLNSNSGSALAMTTDSVGRGMGIYTQDFSGSTGSKMIFDLGSGTGTQAGSIGVTAGGAAGTLSLSPGGGDTKFGGALLAGVTTVFNSSGVLQAASFPSLTGDVTTSAGSLATTLAAGSASVLNSGTLPAGRLPALTGDVTSSAGSAATTLAAGSASVLNSGTLPAGRLPALTGDVTSSAGSAATTLAATSNATIASLDKSTGVAIHGTNTNDSASAGYVGEQICCNTTSIAAGSSNTFVNMCNLTLTAGDWNMGAQALVFPAGGSSISTMDMGISTSSTAATFADKVLGSNWLEQSVATGLTNVIAATVVQYRVSLSGSVTYYLKGSATYTIATPNLAGKMCGTRTR